MLSIPSIGDMQEPKADGATLVEPEDSAVIERSEPSLTSHPNGILSKNALKNGVY